MRKKQKIFFLAGFILLSALSLAIIFGYIKAIMAGGMLAFLIYPLYKSLEKYIKSETIRSFLAVMFVILIIIVPLVFALNVISREAYTFYVTARSTAESGLFDPGCTSGVGCSLVSTVSDMLSNSNIGFYLGEAMKKGTLSLIDSSSNFIFAIPGMALDFFIALFVMYYLLKEGNELQKKFWEFVPLKKTQERKMREKITGVTRAVLFGYLLTALVQGLIGGIGFLIFGFSSPLLWGLIIALAGLFPVVGTAIVWAPASVYQFINGMLSDQLGMAAKGIGLFVYGVFIIGTVDNLIKPKLIGGRAQVHPAIILIGLFGGLKLLGIIGALYGPLILALLLTFARIYRDEMK